MDKIITSLDELWPIPETPQFLLYYDGGVKFVIYDLRPHEYFSTHFAPEDSHFLFLGSDAPNHVTGNNIFNRIYGYGGNDNLSGGNNVDIIFGGSGNDSIAGFDGNDTLHGDSGYDVIYGMGGDDYISGGDQDDFIIGGTGNDTIDGGTGNDFIRGGEDNDIIYGYDGDDLISGDSGDDFIYGGAGDDHLLGDTGTNIISSGAGSDRIYLDLIDQLNIVTDFVKGDAIAVDVTEGIVNTLDAIRSDLNIRWEAGQYQVTETGTNDVNIDDLIIYHSTGSKDLADEYILMVLEDYTDPLNVGDFALI